MVMMMMITSITTMIMIRIITMIIMIITTLITKNGTTIIMILTIISKRISHKKRQLMSCGQVEIYEIYGSGNDLLPEGTRQHAIITTNIDSSTVGFCSIYQKEASLELHMQVITVTHVRIIHLKSKSHPQGYNWPCLFYRLSKWFCWKWRYVLLGVSNWKQSNEGGI